MTSIDTFAGLRTAMAFEHAGDINQAIAAYRTVAEAIPCDNDHLIFAADGLRQMGRLHLAAIAFERALNSDPTALAACYGLAQTQEASGHFTKAQANYNRVASLAPQTPHGTSGAARMALALGDTHNARILAEAALAIDSHDFGAHSVIAQCEAAENKLDDACTRLKALIERQDIPPADHIRLYGLYGQILEKRGDVSDAYRAWQDGNRRFATLHHYPNSLSALERVQTLTASLATLPDRDQAPAQSEPQAPAPIFILGFPRSGTTLVEQILRSIPGVTSSEEEPTLADAANRYLTPEGLGRLSQIGDDERDALRTLYWQRAHDAGIPKNGVYVDMDPMKSLAMPLIATMFPNARVIFVRRNPRDTVFSCFRQTFAYNLPTAEFVSIERAAHYYDAVMRFSSLAMTKFPMKILDLSYERLVTNFDAETRKLCDFTGLPWSADLINFSDHARRGGVRTASTAQVMRPLFDGRGQWKPYAEHLDPHAALLDPWDISNAV